MLKCKFTTLLLSMPVMISFMVSIASISSAQITTRQITEKEWIKPEVYDSTFVPTKYYKPRLLIGQMLFFLPGYDYSDFSTSPSVPFGKDKRSFYHSVKTKSSTPLNELLNDGAYYESDKTKIENSYFQVHDVIIGERISFFKLIHRERHDTAYAQMEEKPFYIVQGHFEKMKKNSVGKTFVFIGVSQQNESESRSCLDIETGKRLEVLDKSEWLCTDFSLIDLKSFGKVPVYILKNSNGEQIAVESKGYKTDLEAKINLFKLKTEIEQEKEWARMNAVEYAKQVKLNDELRKKTTEEFHNKCIASYGPKFGNMIADGRVVIGMTKQMCRDSWGSPSSVNTTVTSLGTLEQWVYSLKTYLYFKNDRLDAIQN